MVAVRVCVTAGPTVLEVFNTLLKHLRMSVDFELGESSRRNSSSSVSSGRAKESEERIVQNAIIQTIGTSFLIKGEVQIFSCLNTMHTDSCTVLVLCNAFHVEIDCCQNE